MTVIWKFRLPPYDDRGMVTYWPVVEMPQGARVLTLQMQDDEPTLWAVVEPEAPPELRQFVIVGTGHEVPAGTGGYVGSWQWPSLVFHLFEVER
jgi:hypothetical protein